MTEYYRQQRHLRLTIDCGICCRCGKKANQTAHRIARTKQAVLKLSLEVIDHNINLVPVCCLECNDSFNIGNDPGKVKKLVELITDNMQTTINNFIDHKQIVRIILKEVTE